MHSLTCVVLRMPASFRQQFNTNTSSAFQPEFPSRKHPHLSRCGKAESLLVYTNNKQD